MEYTEAKDLTDSIISYLNPVCDRISVAGSVRRRAPHVRDLEIVCIPKSTTIDLFATVPAREPEFARRVLKLGRRIKGDPDKGKYVQLQGKKIVLDIFIATPENWGLILAIRTGNITFSHKILATGWRKRGMRGVEGHLTRISTGEIIPVKEETHLFKILGMEYIPPEQRSIRQF